MKLIIGIGFCLFVLSLLIGLVGGGNMLLIPSSVFGGSSLIALAIYTKKF
jgi:hypothetical protein